MAAKFLKFNLSLPPELMVEFDKIAERYEHGGRGIAFSAALIALLEHTREAQDELADEANAAKLKGTFDAVIERAKLVQRPRRDLLSLGGSAISTTATGAVVQQSSPKEPPKPPDPPADPKPQSDRRRALSSSRAKSHRK